MEYTKLDKLTFQNSFDKLSKELINKEILVWQMNLQKNNINLLNKQNKLNNIAPYEYDLKSDQIYAHLLFNNIIDPNILLNILKYDTFILYTMESYYNLIIEYNIKILEELLEQCAF